MHVQGFIQWGGGGGGGSFPPKYPSFPPKKREGKEREREGRREEKRERERGRGSDGEMQTERITAIIIIETQITLDSYMTVLYRITLRGFCSSIDTVTIYFSSSSFRVSGPSIVLTFHHETLKDL